jgi:hypothetical protein
LPVVRARGTGYFKAQGCDRQIEREPDFDAVRSRADYQELLRAVGGKPALARTP